MIRAMEVVRHTGRAFSGWQALPHVGGLGKPPVVIVLDPGREWLYARCDARFDTMLDGGAWHQVKVAMAAGISPDAPVCRGLGTRALMAALSGELETGAAVERAKRETRNYAKRQGTWFRHQFNPDVVLRPPQDLPESPEVLGKVSEILGSRRDGGRKTSAPGAQRE
jgi:tRNA dimethylallyltransferase